MDNISGARTLESAADSILANHLHSNRLTENEITYTPIPSEIASTSIKAVNIM
jgi:hypothetical protein